MLKFEYQDAISGGKVTLETPQDLSLQEAYVMFQDFMQAAGYEFPPQTQSNEVN